MFSINVINIESFNIVNESLDIGLQKEITASLRMYQTFAKGSCSGQTTNVCMVCFW